MIGGRVGLLVRGDAHLLRVLAVVARALPPSADTGVWVREEERLLVTGLSALPAEARSIALDDVVAALQLAGIEARLFVGGADLVPYESARQGWDVEGAPGPEAGVRLFRAPGKPPVEGWLALSSRSLLPRIRPVRRRSRAPHPAWLLASARLFQGLRARFHELGRPFAFAGLRREEGDDDLVLVFLPGGPEPAELAFLERLPELELLDGAVEAPGTMGSADHAPPLPPLLVDRELELPFPVAAVPFLLPAGECLVVRRSGPTLLLEGPPRLLDGDALLAPELAPAPERRTAALADLRPTRLPLTVAPTRDTLRRPVRALLLHPGDVTALLHLRARLPWAVAEQIRMAVFHQVAFLRTEGAPWSLPVGLPYWGDDDVGVYLAQGCALVPDVSLRLARQAAHAAEDHLVFLSPARCWSVPRDAFRPLDTLLDLDPALGRAHLHVEASLARITLPAPPAPDVPDAPAPPKGGRRRKRPEAPPTPEAILAQAVALLVAGKAEEAGVLFERAGAFEQAADAYERAATSTRGP